MVDKAEKRNADKPSAVSSAFIEHETFLKRFLKRFLSLPQDIEDVAQETYLKARSAEKGQVINSPKAFLFRIARNEALKELRKRSRRITDYIEEIEPSGVRYAEASAEEEVVAKQRLGIFCQSALEMTPKCRRAFLMCKVYGMSYKEVASQLGISVSGVEKHVAKGLVICNAYLERMENPISQATDNGEDSVDRVVETVEASPETVVSFLDQSVHRKGQK